MDIYRSIYVYVHSCRFANDCAILGYDQQIEPMLRSTRRSFVPVGGAVVLCDSAWKRFISCNNVPPN